MVTTGSSILASDYNGFRTSVNNLYVSYYGQSARTSAVTGFGTSGIGANTVTQAQLQLLFLDIQGTNVHQTGSLSTTLAVPLTGNTIGADQSLSYNQTTGATGSVTNGTLMGFNDFQTTINTISSFNDAVVSYPVGNFTLGAGTPSTRTTTWGGAGQVQSVYHVVTFTFASTTARTQYFNAGGELRFSASITGGTGPKFTDWAAILSSVGSVRFTKYGLSASSGTSANIGFNGLTGAYQTLFTKTGSGVYIDNVFTIEGYIQDATSLRFRIRFNDGDTGTNATSPVDEPVDGTLVSTVNTFRPDSSFVYNSTTYTAVSLPAPTVTTAVEVSTDNASPPA